jgi:hypothetical protein
MEAGNQTTRPRPRRHFRFSLRTLLVVTTLLALALGYFAAEYKAVRDRSRVIAALQRMGAFVAFDDQGPSESDGIKAWLGMLEVSIVAGINTDEAMELLVGMDKLRSVTVGPGVTDSGLAHLQELTTIEELKIVSDEVTENGLQSVSLLKGLKRLTLSGRQITDDGLRHLAHLTMLESLDISDAGVTDDGLMHLKGLTSLQKLRCRGTATTGAAMQSLVELWNSRREAHAGDK